MMKIRIKTLLIALFCLPNLLSAQGFQEKFMELQNNNDSLGQITLLKEWEKKDIDDPELYVCYFNFYVNQSREEMIRIGNNPQGDQVLQITDTATGETKGYMYGEIFYHPNIVKKGLDYIETGIKKHPNRLDMRFGEIYVYGELKDYDNFTQKIVTAVDYSNVNKNAWTWSKSESVDDSKNFFLGNVQNYQMQLYNTGDDKLLENMRIIAESILKYYPDHVASLSNISIGYLISKDYDKAIEYLKKAEEIDPKDYIVLSNIAHAYKEKKDIKNAIKYYELTAKYGDPQTKSYAETQLKELKN